MPFKIGDQVIDRDGYRGAVVNVTEWRGSRWYDVRLFNDGYSPGTAVRFDDDLRLEEEENAVHQDRL